MTTAGLESTMVRSRKRQREDIVESKDGSQVTSKKKKRSAPASQSTKPPAASESGSQKRPPPQTDTPPQSKPQRQTPNHDEHNHKTNLPRNFWTVDSPFSPPETRPRTQRRPLALARPKTPPMTDEAWAVTFYDADFGSKVCERFEKRQRNRPAKYGDLVVSAFPTLTPPEAREVFQLARCALRWRELRRKWKEELDTIMSVTPDDDDDGNQIA